jgi:hypothetical protein
VRTQQLAQRAMSSSACAAFLHARAQRSGPMSAA